MLPTAGLPGRNIFAGLMPLRASETLIQRSIERMATGRMINRGADDPAGLISGQQLESTIRALEAESRTLARESDYLASRDGALEATGDMVSELRGLAVRAADSTLGDAEREALEMQAASIVQAVEHTASTAEFGDRALLDDDLAAELGATEAADGHTYALADIGRSLNISDDPALAETIADAAAADIATRRGETGAQIATDIEPRRRAIDTELVNLSRAYSAVMDTDYAAESVALTRAQLLADASRFLLSLDSANAGLAADLLGAS